ncbi:MAG TPA: hypothetical protein VFL30_06575 [Rhodanobacteraceae bacterium]|nr:hypothetical protein [Rhodanobacteraceae bacterium]
MSIKRILVCLALMMATTQAFAISPKAGLWWNPAESGRGYAIDVSGNMLVVAVYAYDSDHNPLWYLASGSLSNDGADFHGTFDKFSGGQCMTCAYTAPGMFGSDGAFSIHFTSDTTGDMTLPDGRRIHIETFFGPPSVGALGGLPISFQGIDMQRFDTVEQSSDCKVTLTYKNTTSSAKTVFLYFDVLDANGITVDQMIFHSTSMSPGSTAQDYTYTTAGDAGARCEGFTLQFNDDASDIF